MSKAIGYTRISTKDQSNFSLPFQAEQIINYCHRNNIELIRIYEDKGQSAKNFDRTNWLQLELFIKENYRQVDMLIVMKYDRFSRNLSESLQKIELLEKKYNIRIVSISENFGLHPEDPFFFKMRTTMLTDSQLEWLTIKDRTKKGIRRARLEGRTVNSAPMGYKNIRDEKKLPTLAIDEKKAPVVQQMFEQFLRGSSMMEIYRYGKINGVKFGSVKRIREMLSNPTYAALVKVPALYDMPEEMVKGVFPAIIPEEKWWQVQSLLNGRTKKQHIKTDPRFPLRGVLTYTNGKYFTSYHASGKKIKVPYYRVFVPDKSFNANRAHEKMNEILKTLSLTPLHINYLKEKVIHEMSALDADREKIITKKRSELEAIACKMANIEEDRINRIMDAQTYLKWNYQFTEQKKGIEQELAQIIRPSKERMKMFNTVLPLLTNIFSVYDMADVSGKQSLLRMVFDKGVSYDGDIYRTPGIISIYSPKAALLKEKRLLDIEQPLVNLGEKSTMYRVRESNP